jgi:hypothetical protein
MSVELRRKSHSFPRKIALCIAAPAMIRFAHREPKDSVAVEQATYTPRGMFSPQENIPVTSKYEAGCPRI